MPSDQRKPEGIVATTAKSWQKDDVRNDDGYSPELSPNAAADLRAGLESTKSEPLVYRGSFAQFADDDE